MPIVVHPEEGKVSEHQIRFEDGAAYERMMGTWSRLAGDVFLDWLNPRDRPVRGATCVRTHSV